jgi:hypothetical protein
MPTWQTVREAWPTLIKEVNQLGKQITAAAESWHQKVATQVQHVRQCETTLLLKIRTRLAEALRDDLLLPTWFDVIRGTILLRCLASSTYAGLDQPHHCTSSR